MKFKVGDIIQHKTHISLFLLVLQTHEEFTDCIILDDVQAKYQIWKYDYCLYDKVS